MLNDNSTRLVGPILSCERDLHIQSWTQLIDWRVIHTILPHLQATCAQNIVWDRVIDQEIALSTNLVKEGYSVAGLHPRCEAFGEGHRSQLLQGEFATREELSWCKNVLRADVSNFLELLPSPEYFGFVKFGGTLWRDGLFAKSFVDKVHAETRSRFSIVDSPECYKQRKFPPQSQFFQETKRRRTCTPGGGKRGC